MRKFDQWCEEFARYQDDIRQWVSNSALIFSGCGWQESYYIACVFSNCFMYKMLEKLGDCISGVERRDGWIVAMVIIKE